MDFKYANADGLSTKKHDDPPPKRMKTCSYENGTYTCVAEDGTVWVSNDTVTWRKVSGVKE